MTEKGNPINIIDIDWDTARQSLALSLIFQDLAENHAVSEFPVLNIVINK